MDERQDPNRGASSRSRKIRSKKILFSAVSTNTGILGSLVLVLPSQTVVHNVEKMHKEAFSKYLSLHARERGNSAPFDIILHTWHSIIAAYRSRDAALEYTCTRSNQGGPTKHESLLHTN
jgi:hypothetical protein